jgi:hypothetical protein
VNKRDADSHQQVRNLIKTSVFCVLWWVMDEAGRWSIPISVYSDSDIEIFVPDITRILRGVEP